MLPKTVMVLLFIFVFVFGCGEDKEAFYSNIDAARRSGAIERGWLPDILPESSTEIHERHDLDTNAVWIRFKFDRKDTRSLIGHLEEVTPAEMNPIEFTRPSLSWWPKDLSKDSLIKGKHLGMKLYKYNRVVKLADNRQKIVPSFFLIDWSSTVAYYWQYAS